MSTTGVHKTTTATNDGAPVEGVPIDAATRHRAITLGTRFWFEGAVGHSSGEINDAKLRPGHGPLLLSLRYGPGHPGKIFPWVAVHELQPSHTLRSAGIIGGDEVFGLVKNNAWNYNPS